MVRVRMRPLSFAVEGGDSQLVAGEQPQTRHLRRGLGPMDHHHASLLRLLVSSLVALLSAILLVQFPQRPAVALAMMAEPQDVDLADGWESINVHFRGQNLHYLASPTIGTNDVGSVC